MPQGAGGLGPILTQLRIEGSDITPKYEDMGVVIVRTCGFIGAAKEESSDKVEFTITNFE